MSKLRINGTIGLAIVFLAFFARYAFFQPFIPGAVRTAIPAQASFIHQADRIEELLESPVCGQIDKALGAGNSLEALMAGSTWGKTVVPSELAVADMPLRYAGQTKAWAMVSWVGWRSPWLRWRLERTRADGFSFLGKHAAWPIWKYEGSNIARGSTLTFALTDNLFMACLSEDPADILLLLDTYDRRNPSIIETKQGNPK